MKWMKPRHIDRSPPVIAYHIPLCLNESLWNKNWTICCDHSEKYQSTTKSNPIIPKFTNYIGNKEMCLKHIPLRCHSFNFLSKLRKFLSRLKWTERNINKQGKKYVDNMHMWVWTSPWSHSQANIEKPLNQGKQRVARKYIFPPTWNVPKVFP
jgi:hypothetical protein